MRKSRISFSISKKSSKSEGNNDNTTQQTTSTEGVPLSAKEPQFKPSSYYACRFCCKRFKSEKTYETHQRSKNHAKAVATGSASEQKKSRTCAGCHQSFDTRLQLTEHCKRFSHMPLVQKTALRNPEYGKAYTVSEQEDPFVSIKYYSPYYCEVCDLDCVCDNHYQDHVKGTRHKKALEKRAEQGSGVLVDLDTHEVDGADKCLVIMNKLEPVIETVSAYYCGICDTDCRSELAYTEHVTGKDHQVRMEGHGQIKISCDLCCMTFNSENNYKMHLKSKKHANNEAARQRLLPLEIKGEAEKGESMQDLRDKIKRTLSPTLENFDKIKVNVATVASQESAVRSVTITDEEMEADEATFMEMGKPNVGERNESDSSKKEKNPKLKELELERDKWAKKKEEEYARRKAESEKSRASSRWDSERTRGAPRGRGRGGFRGRGRGRGRGRFAKDDKFTWVNPLFDENGKKVAEKEESRRDRDERRSSEKKRDTRDSKSDRDRERDNKSDRDRDRDNKSDRDRGRDSKPDRDRDRDSKPDRDRDRDSKPDRDRDSKSDKREKRRSYDDEKDSKKRDSDSSDEEEYKERVILKRGERKRERSSSDDEDLRKVINKQRSKVTKEKSGNSSDEEYVVKTIEGIQPAEDDGLGSLVFDYGHKHVERREEASGERGGFFGGNLSGYYDEPEYAGPQEPPRPGYYAEQRPAAENPREMFGPPELPQSKNVATERTLLLELLKRQFPDIRYLAEQQGGLELMRRIFGELQGKGFGAGGSDVGSDGGSDGGGRLFGRGDMGLGLGDSRTVGLGDRGVGLGDSRSVGLGHSRDAGLGDSRGVKMGDSRGVKMEEGGDGGEEDDTYGPAPPQELLGGRKVLAVEARGDDRRVIAADRMKTEGAVPRKTAETSKKQGRSEEMTAKEKEAKSSTKATDARGGEKKQPEKTSGSRDSRRRSRSRSRERRRRSRSSSRERSKYSSRKRSRSRSRDRSSGKKSKRSPSPTRSSKKDEPKPSTKRKASVSPKRGDKEKAEGRSAEDGGDKKSSTEKESLVSQTKAKSKDAKEKVIAKWTVSNWSGKEEPKAEREKKKVDEKTTEEKDKKSKEGDKKRERDNSDERRRRSDRGEEKAKESSRGRRGSIDENDKRKGDTNTEDKIFEDASDYEDVPLDDMSGEHDLREQFENDYDERPEVEKRRERVVDERGSRLPARGSHTARLEAALAETMARLRQTVPRLDDVRKSIPLAAAAPDDVDYDPYSYENRAFEAQEDISEPPMSMELLTQLALHYERLGTGPPYPPVADFYSTPAGQAFLRSSTKPALGAGPNFPPRFGGPLTATPGHRLPTVFSQRGLGTGLGLLTGPPRGGNQALGMETSPVGGNPGARTSSALMYIQPTDEPVQTRQVRPIPTERSTNPIARLATSQASISRGSSDRNIPISSSSALRTISPVQRTISPVPRTISPVTSRASGTQSVPSGGRHEQITDRDSDSSGNESMDEAFARHSDSDQYGSESASSKPLKSILKKKSKFPAVDVPTSQSSDTEVPVSSGNLPKNTVGAQYVVQNAPQASGEQGRFFCQLCDVQFTTLSAKNLHLRGPKHLAMFMKSKTPLIDEMIQQAMGLPRSSLPEKEKEKEASIEPKEQTVRDWRDVSPSRDEKETEPKDSERSGGTEREQAKKARETDETSERGYPPETSERGYPSKTSDRGYPSKTSDRDYPSDIAYEKRSLKIDEPRLYIDEKTGRFVQAQGYYSDELKDEENTDIYGGKKYSEATTTARDDRVRDETDLPRKQDYPTYRDDYGQLGARREGDVSRDEYGQLGIRRDDDVSRDEYARIPSARGYLETRDDYERRRERSPPPRQDYGNLPARDTEDYGRLPPSREDLARQSYDYLRSERDLAPTSDDYRRVVPPEQRLPDSRRLTADEYGGRLPRDPYEDDKDWRSARSAPLVRESTGDQSRDYSYGEPRAVAKETLPSSERKPSQYAMPGETADNPPRDWPTAARESAKDVPERAGDERAEEPRAGYTKPTEDPERRDSGDKRRDSGDKRRDTAPERYPRDYESRTSSGDSRRVSDTREAREEDAPDGGYDRQSYREPYGRGYSGERYSERESTYDRSSARTDRHDQPGYGYDRSQRGRGSRGRGGPGMGGRGGPRGYPRKPGFNRPPRQGWKGGQGRY